MLLMLLIAGRCPSGLQPKTVCLSPVQGATYAGGPVDPSLVDCMSSLPDRNCANMMHVTYPIATAAQCISLQLQHTVSRVYLKYGHA